MKQIMTILAVLLMFSSTIQSQNNTNDKSTVKKEQSSDFYGFRFDDSKGSNVSMADFKGKTVLVVNVASKCGFTKQYTPLEELYKKLKDKGFVILGFPCNQFGGQEPGTNEEIQSFCQLNFGVTFPVYAKIEVNGPKAHPLYVWLKSQTGGGDIKWNFNKFLVDKNGKIIKRYDSGDSLDKLEQDIKAVL
jgi:glutathione peroxidase